MNFLAFLLLALYALQTSETIPQATPSNALALLTEVSQQYADAKSYHIEAVEEEESSNELRHSWEKTLMTVIAMPDGRYRYEGRSGFGSAIVVSDGTTKWRYHLYENLYIQQAASKYPAKGEFIPQEESAAVSASMITRELAGEAHRLNSASYLPDEVISVDGRMIECYVVRYSSDDYKTKKQDFKQERTIWIDKSRKLIVRTVTHADTYLISGSAHIPLHRDTTLTFPVMRLDEQEPPSSFAFVPPAGAELVAEFPNPFTNNGRVQSELVGKPAPEVEFKSADNKTTALSSLRGKPVFIEFWATSCGPCVKLLPDLSKLYFETQKKGLVWISVDDDEDANDVSAYLSKNHLEMPWTNYHDADGALGKAFHREAIPLGVLMNASGKIVFHQSGYEISDLRAAILQLGPEFASDKTDMH